MLAILGLFRKEGIIILKQELCSLHSWWCSHYPPTIPQEEALQSCREDSRHFLVTFIDCSQCWLSSVLFVPMNMQTPRGSKLVPGVQQLRAPQPGFTACSLCIHTSHREWGSNGKSSYPPINFILIIEDRGVKKIEAVIQRSMKKTLLFSMLGKGTCNISKLKEALKIFIFTFL